MGAPRDGGAVAVPAAGAKRVRSGSAAGSPPRVLGGTRARGVTDALHAAASTASPAATAAAASARARLMAVRERAVVGAIAGALAGAFVNGVLHPLDTIKVQLQLRGSPFSGPRAVVAAQVARLGRAGAVARLYRGAPAAVVGSGLSSALYFGMYDAAKAAGAPPPLAALFGNALSSLVLVPKEVVKSRMQAGEPGGALAVLGSALRARGLRGIYAGYAPTLLRNAPSNMISFSAYEALKAAAGVQLRRRARRRGVGDAGGAEAPVVLPAPVTAVAGAAAGALAAVCTHPLDLVKTRLQTQGMTPPRGLALYAGVGGTLRAVAAAEGVRGLARGLSTRLFYNALFSALGLAAYESAKRAVAAARTPREQQQGDAPLPPRARDGKA